LGEGLNVAIDDLVACDVGVGGVTRRRVHDDEPVLKVAPVEEDRLLGRAFAPVRGRVLQRGCRRLGRKAPHPRAGRGPRRPRLPRREEARGSSERAQEGGDAAAALERTGEEERARRRRHGGGQSAKPWREMRERIGRGGGENKGLAATGEVCYCRK